MTTNKYNVIQNFWSGFGWKAYNESTVPDDVLENNDNRYIAYESATDSIGSPLYLHASLWHRSTSWTTIHAKVAEIANYIENQMPPSLPFDGGRVMIRMGTPFAQDMRDEDDTLRRVVLLVEIEFLSDH